MARECCNHILVGSVPRQGLRRPVVAAKFPVSQNGLPALRRGSETHQDFAFWERRYGGIGIATISATSGPHGSLFMKASCVGEVAALKLRRAFEVPKASACGTWEAGPGWGTNVNEGDAEAEYVFKAEVKGRQSGRQQQNGSLKKQGKGEERAEREVVCQVEVVSWRERHVSASICIETSTKHVWDVLTDYERLAEFIPNLVRSEIIPCPHPGRLWVLQQGRQAALYWQIEARVVLDLEEFPRSGDGGEIRFSMVDGDFKRYSGKWFLKRGSRPGTTSLHYEVNVAPKLLFPAAFMERIIRADLPVNLRAVADRAERGPRLKLKSSAWKQIPSSQACIRNFFQRLWSVSTSAPCAVDANSSVLSSKKTVPNPVQGSLTSEYDGLKRWRAVDPPWTGLRRALRSSAADEVHLRRFDDLLENGGVHRRVVAAITVQAPIQDVWTVLTAYECLPQFIPNLAFCKILSEEKDKRRVLQEGCKCLLYMVLHARVVLDLQERQPYEITFQQVEGDFESFSGSWTLEQLGNEHTLLKYAVDAKMYKDCLLAEAIVEEVIYEDLPANLCAIRDQVEIHGKHALQTMDEIVTQSALRNASPCLLPGSNSSSSSSSSSGSRDRHSAMGRWKGTPKRRPPVPGLRRSYEVLEGELRNFIEEFGKSGVMPMRYELRKHGRVDLEKAIARMGGSAKVAEKMGLALAYKQRKPKGYWDELDNISKEILLFQEESGQDSKVMPTRRSLEKAGRYGLARALEKWGGLQEVANHLGLHVKFPKSRLRKEDMPLDTSNKASSSDFEISGAVNMPVKTSLPPRSTKWLTIQRD